MKPDVHDVLDHLEPSVNHDLCDVIGRLCLHPPGPAPGSDQGSWQPSPKSKLRYYYQRGITAEKRHTLDQKEKRGRISDRKKSINNAWDYYIIYRKMNRAEEFLHQCGGTGIVVEAIWPASKLANAVNITVVY